MSSTQLVWFKRDLRVTDHAPLSHALSQVATHGPVVCLYCIEPALWAQPDAARQHYHFVLECLRDLREQLQRIGLPLYVLHANAVEALGVLHTATAFTTLLSHEETGNAASYARDIAVGQWTQHNRITWLELPQFGVERGLQVRARWAAQWERHMGVLPLLAPTGNWHDPRVSNGLSHLTPAMLRVPSADQLGLPTHEPAHRQRGGRDNALGVLNSFLNERSGSYRGGISSPLTAPTACSRLSPYLTFGCISMREVVQATRHAAAQAQLPARNRQGLNAMVSRLHWHCHFIQKLETEPAIEWRNMHQGYNGLREADWNDTHFQALTTGQTGWPMVDASVAMLQATGWINFRMRAMLVSVAAYPLWLHWRDVGTWLATQFLDYEPGIHWSQMQMQSGTTGINTTRVYNPVKQAQDHDPQGEFVRRWLPALRQVPDTWLLEPWRMPESVQQNCGVRVGIDIPTPVVDLELATRQAKQRLHTYRAQDHVRAGKASVIKRHASQRAPINGQRSGTPTRQTASRRTAAVSTKQDTFDF